MWYVVVTAVVVCDILPCLKCTTSPDNVESCWFVVIVAVCVKSAFLLTCVRKEVNANTRKLTRRNIIVLIVEDLMGRNFIFSFCLY